MKKLSLLLVLGILFSSCGHKFSLQKRRYQKGFYFTAHTSKQHSEAKQQGKMLSFEKRKSEPQAKSNVPTTDNLREETLNNVLQVNENSNKALQSGVKPVQFLKSKNSNRLYHPMQALNTKAVKQYKHKQNILKQLNKRDGRDFLTTVYIGYIVVALIALFISGVSTLGLAQTLILIALTILGIMILYIIGKIFMSLFGR